MITNKTKQAIVDEAYEQGQKYNPITVELSPSIHFEEGFIKGAMWATEKMSKAILKVVNK